MHRSAPRPFPLAALLLLALAPGAVPALVHDRLPGDDAGGALSLPAPSAIGEDGGAPVHGETLPAAPAGGAVADAA